MVLIDLLIDLLNAGLPKCNKTRHVCIVKMTILLKAIYRFNTIPIKFPIEAGDRWATRLSSWNLSPVDRYSKIKIMAGARKS